MQYACLRRTLGAWRARSAVAAERPAWDTLRGSGIALLRDFLGALTPARRRKFFLSLPRDRIFMRSFSLPDMPLEEALEAARNALPVYCHLPVNELYYDIQFKRPGRGRSIEAMLYYAPRRDLDVYIEIFKETGHQGSLGGILPFSVSLAAWLNRQGYQLPRAVLMQQESWQELALFEKHGLSFSISWPANASENETPQALATARVRWPEVDQHLFRPDQDGGAASAGAEPLPAPPLNRLDRLPPVFENRAVAALSMPLVRQQQISLDGRPVRPKFLRLWKVVTPLVALFAILLGVWTYQSHQALTLLEQDAQRLRAEIGQVQQEVQPLEQQRAAILQSQELIQDINEFMQQRPRLYDTINEIARLAPEDTWFSNFGFRDGVITMTGFSSDALKTLEALRTSAVFEEVSLQGTVSRTRAGQEQLSITMTINPNPPTVDIQDVF